MQLTRYTDLSVRVLVYLSLKQEELSTISEIAERYKVSKNHLTKIVHQLSRYGYIHTVRGKYGGIRLQRPADEIVIGKLVREMEPDFRLVECMTMGQNGNHCIITPVCSLKSMFDEALSAFLNTLDQYTLVDVLKCSQLDRAVQILQIK